MKPISQAFSSVLSSTTTIVDGMPTQSRVQSAAFDPRTVSTGTVILWLDPAVGITADGSNLVSSWISRDTGAKEFVQATGANQPTYSATAVNNYPGVQFGSARRMSAPTFSATGNRYIFAVLDYATNPVSTSASAWVMDGAMYGSYVPDTNGTCYEAFGRSTPNVSFSFGGRDPRNAFVYTVYTNSSGTWTAYVNGTQVHTTASAPGTMAWPASTLYLGSASGTSTSARIGDVVVVDSAAGALSGADFNYILNGLVAKYGIT